MSNLAIVLTVVANGVLGFVWLHRRERHVLHRSRVDAIAIGAAALVNTALLLPTPTYVGLRGWIASAAVGGLLAWIAHLLWTARERSAHVDGTR